MLVNKARRDIAWAGLNANDKLLLDRAEWVGPTFVAASKNQEVMKRCAAQRRKAARDGNNDEYAQAAVQQNSEPRARAYYSNSAGGCCGIPAFSHRFVRCGCFLVFLIVLYSCTI